MIKLEKTYKLKCDKCGYEKEIDWQEAEKIDRGCLFNSWETCIMCGDKPPPLPPFNPNRFKGGLIRRPHNSQMPCG